MLYCKSICAYMLNNSSSEKSNLILILNWFVTDVVKCFVCPWHGEKHQEPVTPAVGVEKLCSCLCLRTYGVCKSPKTCSKKRAHKFLESFIFQNPCKIFHRNVLVSLYWNFFCRLVIVLWRHRSYACSAMFIFKYCTDLNRLKFLSMFCMTKLNKM